MQSRNNPPHNQKNQQNYKISVDNIVVAKVYRIVFIEGTANKANLLSND